MDQSSFLLGGERGGEKIEGYHLGNSPLEYEPEVVAGRTIILNTTNGTGALARSRGATHLLVGSFLNAARVVDFTKEAGLDVAIVCAGWRNRVSLEDTICAGLLLHRLWDGEEPEPVSDTAHIAFSQYQYDQHDLAAAIRRCNHAQWLARQGHAEDLEYCLQVDTLPVLPYHTESRIVLRSAASSAPSPESVEERPLRSRSQDARRRAPDSGLPTSD